MRLLALGLGLVLMSRAAPGRAQSSDPLDQALAPVLRSGCGEGLAALAALAERTDVSAADRATAARVLRLCQQVGSGPAGPGAELDRSGRGKLVFGSTVFGIWTGAAADVMTDLEGRVLVIPPLIGGGAGLALSLLATRDGPMSSGQAWGIITGFDYGTYSGLIWGAAADSDDEKVVFGTALGTGVAAGGLATWLMTTRPALQGDIEVVRSGGLWGFATGALLAGIVQPASDRTTFVLMGAGIDGGLLAGVGLARVLDLPRNRMLLIDTASLGGGLVGFAVAFLIVGQPEGGNPGRVLAGSALAGLYAGMGLGIYLTRGMRPDAHEALLDVPALIARGADGRWGAGHPTVLPVITPGGTGARLSGAQLSLLGGVW
jgi:hypothetical protein